MAVISIRVAGLAAPPTLEIRKLITQLNNLQNFYQFDYLGYSQFLGSPDRSRRHYSIDLLATTFHNIYPDSTEYPYEILLTDEKIEDDYFSKITNHLGIISSADTDLVVKDSGKSLFKYFAYNIMETLLWLQYGHEHELEDEDIGCLFDSCYTKRSNIVLGLTSCKICSNCERILAEEKHVPREQLMAIENVLRWVKRPPGSVYGKWITSLGLLAGGLGLTFLPATLNAGVAIMTASGWLAASPHTVWRLRRGK